jgi:uncharacterized repeat protein (TIGR02543 family)
VRLLTSLAVFLSIGVCASAQPTLSVSVSHNENFVQGQTNAYFLIRVSNVGVGPTTAAVQVTDHSTTGFTITSLSGEGWTCSNVTCDRSDVLAAGKNYPAIVALATIDPSAGSTITFQVTTYFGGDPNTHTATDTVNVSQFGYPVAWGGNQFGESVVPTSLSNAVALSGGGSDTLALTSTGTVLAWGDNTYGETTVPATLTDVLAVSAGDMFSLALKSNGTVVAWGDNTYGETTLPSGLTNVVGIAAGRYHGLALKADGTVVAWGVKSGANFYGQTTVPAGLSNVVAVAAGWYHSVALRANGTVVAWGYPTDNVITVPGGLTNVVAIAAGAYHTLALTSGGTVAAWGADTDGQIDVPTLVNPIAIAAGWDHSLALQSNGILVGWGYNGYAQLQIPGSLDNITGIAAGGYHSLALNSVNLGLVAYTVNAVATGGASPPNISVDGGTYSGAGVLFNWYAGYYSTSDGWVPGPQHSLGAATVTPGATGVQYVWTGWSDGGAATHLITLPQAPTTYTAYFSTQYLLTTAIAGTGSGTLNLSPGGGPYWFSAGTVASLTATAAAGSVFTGWTGACTGNGPCNLTVNAPATVTANFASTTGNPVALSVSSTHTGPFLQNQAYAVYLLRVANGPTAGTTSGPVTVIDTLPTGLTMVSITGTGWTCSTTVTTTPTCSQADAVLSAGQSAPTIVLVVKVTSTAASVTNRVSVSYNSVVQASATDVTAIDATGYPLAWGLDSSGQSAVPSGLTNVLAVAGGAAHSLLLRANGTVEVWGDNSLGQTSPLPGGLAEVVAIAAGANHSLALTSNGTVLAWGDDTYGQIDVPVALSSPSCSTQPCAVAIAAGANHSLALMSDGSVVGWGYDVDGEIDIPAGLANVVGIAGGGSHSLAVTNGGAVWAWGSNALGQTAVPAGLTSIVAVAAGQNHSLALSSAGAVTAWGDNTYGQSAVPSTLAGVGAIAAGGNHSLALKTGGTVIAWGDSTYDEKVISSTLTKGVAIAAGLNHNLAVNSGSAGGVAITLSSAQPGTIITVDGNKLSAKVVVDWGSGTSHTLVAPSPQAAAAGSQYVFASWSDAGAATHTVTPTSATAYTANFTTQYQLTTAVSNTAAGTISPATGWYNSGTAVTVTKTVKTGYKFTGWSGACSGTGACKVTMSAPESVTANFNALPAVLSITSTHTGDFYRGEDPAYYTLKVSNSATAGPTVGTVTVTEYVPAGMTLLAMSGTGWSCTLGSSDCTRSDALAPGASYPTISVSVYVSTGAPASATNGAGVTGGGSTSAGASDPTVINPTAP